MKISRAATLVSVAFFIVSATPSALASNESSCTQIRCGRVGGGRADFGLRMNAGPKGQPGAGSNSGGGIRLRVPRTPPRAGSATGSGGTQPKTAPLSCGIAAATIALGVATNDPCAATPTNAAAPAGQPAPPVLTVPMIESEWSFTPFAAPQLSIQPVNNRTLVNLPTYFAVNWSAAGYAPGEVRTVTLVGRSVRIKPTLTSNNFIFGDGNSSGPTTSMGGAWPSGNIRHAYENAGSFATSVRTTYGGQYSIDGGEWIDLPGTTVVTGPAQSLQVLTSTNRLY